MVFYENVDTENKLDILYRLMDMGYSREWCKDTFIELFESLSKDEMSSYPHPLLNYTISSRYLEFMSRKQKKCSRKL